MDYPKLRNVEAFPAQVDGKRMICFRDPERLTPEMVLLPYESLFIISLFDGNHSVQDIQAEYMRRFGDLLYSDHIVTVAEHLDHYYLLENDHYKACREKIEHDFLQAPVRSPLLAGTGYASDPQELRNQLASFFTGEGGPGIPEPQSSEEGLKGLIAPHIDFMRGGPCYAWAYKQIAERSREDVFILLGTSHVPTKKYFVLTKKDFRTPFGVLPSDPDILRQLEKEVGADFFSDELVHRNEHSLEFQAVYLHYLFETKRPITIVPILCGPFHEIISKRSVPHDVQEVVFFLRNLRMVLQADGRRMCVIAGADLAHVGPQFGDPFRISRAVLSDLRAQDLAMLDYVIQGDAEGFFDYIMREGDCRKICGLPPIYALLALIEGTKGILCNYSQWRDPDGNGAVTFAGIAFH